MLEQEGLEAAKHTDTSPSLALLTKLCFFADANLVALLKGRFEAVGGPSGLRAQCCSIEKGRDLRVEKNRDEIRDALVEAVTTQPPRSAAQVACRFQLSARQLRAKLPAEVAALTSAGDRYRVADRRNRYKNAVETYTRCADELKADGVKISAKYLQERSVLVASSTQATRAQALNEVIARYASSK